MSEATPTIILSHTTDAVLTQEPLELSVVIPCLNESETIGICVKKALTAILKHGIRAEVVVADNGSTDGAQTIAEELGARVVSVTARGYGNALMGGIATARGKYVIMGDADDSYDFTDLPRFVDKLREGFDLVQGCRLPSGGGRVLPGAMKFTHRWIGNPIFSRMSQWMFGAPIHDIYCGMRGFTKELYAKLDQRCTGMEFAAEMIIKAILFKAKIAEVPITLHPDGRKLQRSHLHTLRDGWRTLRFFMLFSPKWLFFIPGLLLLCCGAIGYALALPAATLFGATFDAHTLLVASMALILGHQCLLFAVFAKSFAISEGLMPLDWFTERFYAVYRLERGILCGTGLILVGLALIGVAGWIWTQVQFGSLNYAQTMRLVVPGVTCVVLGFQTVMSSFFIGILRMRRK